MSVKVMAQVWESSLPHPEKFVLLALADHAQDDGTHVYPSIAYTAWKCDYTERNVQLVIGRLKRKGILVVVAHERGGQREGQGLPTVYRIALDAIPAKAPFNKGENISPFSESRVKLSTKKGEKNSTSRVKKTAKKGEAGFTQIIMNHHIEPSEKHARAHARKDGSEAPDAVPLGGFGAWMISPQYDKWRQQNNIRATTPLHVIKLAYLRWREEQQKAEAAL